MGYIYKLELLQDTESFNKGDIYIGKHSKNLSWYFTGGKIVKNLIGKYGKEIFSRTIIDEIDNEELLSDLEKYYIVLYKCDRPRTGKGLNLTKGGSGGQSKKGPKHSEETRKRMSESRKIYHAQHPEQGKRFSERRKDPNFELKRIQNMKTIPDSERNVTVSQRQNGKGKGLHFRKVTKNVIKVINSEGLIFTTREAANFLDMEVGKFRSQVSDYQINKTGFKIIPNEQS